MIKKIEVKSILNKHKKRDSWFLDDYSLGPYQACPFNCVYCFIRGSKYGHNMSKTLAVKVNAPELLEKQLARRAEKGEHGIIFISSSGEAYMPLEKELRMTRKLLEIVYKYKFPVHIQTKATLIPRDFNLLKKIDKEAVLPKDLKGKLKRGAIISFSFSNLDEKLTKIFEPGAPKPKERLKTLQKCRKAGFLVGAAFIPLLPFISDREEEIERMVKTAKAHGANFVLVGGLTLFGKEPTDCKMLYYNALQKHFPELVAKTRSLFRIFFAPPKEYQGRLDRFAKKFCKKYKVRYGILPK